MRKLRTFFFSLLNAVIFAEIKPDKLLIISYFECKSWPTNTFGRVSSSNVRKVLERIAVHYLFLGCFLMWVLIEGEMTPLRMRVSGASRFILLLSDFTKTNDSLKNSGNVFIPVQGEELRQAGNFEALSCDHPRIIVGGGRVGSWSAHSWRTPLPSKYQRIPCELLTGVKSVLRGNWKKSENKNLKCFAM